MYGRRPIRLIMMIIMKTVDAIVVIPFNWVDWVRASCEKIRLLITLSDDLWRGEDSQSEGISIVIMRILIIRVKVFDGIR